MRRLAAFAVAVASLALVDLSCNGGVNPGQIHQHQHEGRLPVHCSAQVGPTCIGATPGPELAGSRSRWTITTMATLVTKANVHGAAANGTPRNATTRSSAVSRVAMASGIHVLLAMAPVWPANNGAGKSGSVVPRSPESASAAPAMKTGIGTSCEGINILIEPSMVRVGFPHHPGSQVEGKVRIVAGACPPTSGTVTAWLQRYSFPPLGSPPGTPGSWHVAAGPRSVSVAGIEAPRVIRFLDAVCRPHHWWRLRIHGEDITDQGVPTSFTRCWPGGGVSWRCFRGRQGRFYLSCG